MHGQTVPPARHRGCLLGRRKPGHVINKTILLFFGVFIGTATVLTQTQTPNAALPADALTRLARQLELGEATLEYREGAGYLPSLLERLKVNVDSQMLDDDGGHDARDWLG